MTNLFTAVCLLIPQVSTKPKPEWPFGRCIWIATNWTSYRYEVGEEFSDGNERIFERHALYVGPWRNTLGECVTDLRQWKSRNTFSITHAVFDSFQSPSYTVVDGHYWSVVLK